MEGGGKVGKIVEERRRCEYTQRSVVGVQEAGEDQMAANQLTRRLGNEKE